MSVEAFLFAALLLVALVVLPDTKRPKDVSDEVTPAVVMDLLHAPDYRRDGLRK